MPKKRIYEVAKDFKISSDALMGILKVLKFAPKSHMSVCEDEMLAAVQRRFDIEKANAKRDIDQKKKTDNRPAPRGRVVRRDGAAVASSPSSGAPPAAVASAPAVPVAPAAPFVPVPHTQLAQAVQDTLRGVSRAPAADSRSGGRGTAGAGRPGMGGGGRFKKGKKGRSASADNGPRVDASEVSKSFRSTMATIGGAKPKTKKYRRRGAAEDEVIDVERIIPVTEFMTVGELAKFLEVRPGDIIGKLLQLGQLSTINQRLDLDSIEMISLEFGFGIEVRAEVGEFAKEEEQEVHLEHRPPVVTVMGHVDHGKTSLLDFIRKADVASGEAGAITQHIGAYQVTNAKGQKITFLDTPGHEAFTAMRARGAQITDLVVLVVAADDGVQPQTIEAIDHAKAAKAPIIVAINKIDKAEANVERVKQDLTAHGLVTEEWGGDTQMVPLSAKKGTNVDKLLELILMTAELLDLKADPSIRGLGAVVESRLERGRGPVATVMVQKGTVRVGDPVVAGACFGKVRSIMDDHMRVVDHILPGTPGQITGLSGVPQAGDSFMVVKDETEAREISGKRLQLKREHEFRRPKAFGTLEGIYSQIKEGRVRDLHLVVKGDVDGSVEALADMLGAIASDEVRVNIIHKGVGAITESDVLLAAASDALIVGFHVNATSRAREVAVREHVEIKSYSIIYEAEKDIRNALEGMLVPTEEEKFLGSAEVRDVFRSAKFGNIAGCHIQSGAIKRTDRVNLVREGRKIYTGTLGSLRRFKDDVREVLTGYECGIKIENYNDVKVGDMIEAFEIVQVARTLQLK